MKIIKKILGTLFLLETFMGIYLFLFREEFRESAFATILAIVFFAFLTYVCFKKPRHMKKKAEFERKQNKKSKFEPNKKALTQYEEALARHRIPDLARLIEESYQIMVDTNNPETLCSRHKFITEKVNELSVFQQQGLLTQNTFSRYHILVSDENYYDLILKCYQKYMEKARSELKTKKGIDSRASIFLQIIRENTSADIYSKISNELDVLEDNSPSSFVQYVETDKTIYRTDGKAITEEEVPYLMQLGDEKALEEMGLYNGQILDSSSIDARDKNKKEYTRTPTYQELSKIEPRDSYVSLAELSFLNYINGFPLVNPPIAQKWYYDYDLNYGKTIENLIANELLTIEHANIDRLKVNELKNLLKHFDYPTTGQKADLQARIYQSISQTDIDSYFGDAKYFSITPKGRELVNRCGI